MNPLQSEKEHSQTGRERVTRRDFLNTAKSAGMGALLATSLPAFSSAAEPSPEVQPSVRPEDLHKVEQLAHDVARPLSLACLDLLGTASFVDAISSMAVQKDSYADALCRLMKVPGCSGEHYVTTHSPSKFPLGNIWLSGMLTALRSTCFGPEVRRHTMHEFQTTLVGVSLLLGLTSMAKGMLDANESTFGLAKADPLTLLDNPRTELARSIFQLTVLPVMTQLPLTAFGNASIGNGEYKTIQTALSSLYDKVGADHGLTKSGLVAAIAASDNPQIAKRLGIIVDEIDSGMMAEDEATITSALRSAATSHTKDLMTILMSTACDDAHVALGDAGPIVGLYQSYGMQFLAAIPATLPYTAAIAFDRAAFAAKRAGLAAGEIFSRENCEYGVQFLTSTWLNLGLYFLHTAPRIATRVAGEEYRRKVFDGGRDFNLIEQVLSDVKNTASAIFDTIRSEGSYNRATVERTLRELGTAVSFADGKVGELLRERLNSAEGPLSLKPAEVREIHETVVGPLLAEDGRIAALQQQALALASKPELGAIMNFTDELNHVREAYGEELLNTIASLPHGRGHTPSLEAVARLMKEKPGVLRLIDTAYWHDRIGPELTDTLFVVFLQGLHLPFVISSVKQFVYDQRWFKDMSLTGREWLSVALNDLTSMFADNWADCVAHSKWLTNMYFDDLRAGLNSYAANIGDPSLRAALNELAAFEHHDDDTALVPERFNAFRMSFTDKAASLMTRHPEHRAGITAAVDELTARSERHYYNSMIMSLLPAVTGGGKALTGNAPHFTFAAGQDLTLGDTLGDFRRHPLYHVWEFVFSTGYATVAGPYLARHAFGRMPGAEEQLHHAFQRMQARFEKDFPGLAGHFAEGKLK